MSNNQQQPEQKKPTAGMVQAGELLKHFRERAHLTHEELAGRIGVNPTAIRSYERRNLPLFPLTFGTLAAALDLSKAEYTHLLRTMGIMNPTDFRT